jgi:hypothetical protein
MTDPPPARRVRVDGHGRFLLLSSSPAVLLFRGGSYGASYARARNEVLASGAAVVLSFANSKFGASAHVLRLDGEGTLTPPVCLVWKITNAL